MFFLTYPGREVYPSTPLALVATEIRYSESARLRQQATRDAITLALESRFPYAERTNSLAFSLAVGQAGPVPQVSQHENAVLLNESRTESMTITPQSLLYETTDYADFESLASAVALACDALIGAGVRPALERIGLRYIDEVRADEQIADVSDWSQWIDPRLVDQIGTAPAGATIRALEGVIQYELSGGRGLQVRYAALNRDPVVAPPILKRSREFGHGSFFVLDFDGFREFKNTKLTPLTTSLVVKTLAEVHGPAGEAFQNSITDRARELFRKARQ